MQMNCTASVPERKKASVFPNAWGKDAGVLLFVFLDKETSVSSWFDTVSKSEILGLTDSPCQSLTNLGNSSLP